jgi:hypothetical protein
MFHVAGHTSRTFHQKRSDREHEGRPRRGMEHEATVDILVRRLSNLDLPVVRNFTVGDEAHHVVIIDGARSRTPVAIIDVGFSRKLQIDDDASCMRLSVRPTDIAWALGKVHRFCSKLVPQQF